MPVYRPHNVSTAPTAYWKLNEASGNRADSSGNGHTLTDGNTVGSTTGKTDTLAADFELDNNEYLTAADHADWDYGTGDFTMCAWVKPETMTAGAQTIFGRNTGGNSNACDLWLTSSNIIFAIAAAPLAYATVLSAGTWYHIGAKRVSGNVRIFLNGSQVQAGNLATSVSYTTAQIVGNFQAVDTTFGAAFDGLIQDAAIWKGYAISDTEFSKLAAMTPIGGNQIIWVD